MLISKMFDIIQGFYPRDVLDASRHPRDVLDEILNLIESVSEGFPSYSFMKYFVKYQGKIDIAKRINAFCRTC